MSVVLFSQVTSNTMQGNCLMLHQGRFRLDIPGGKREKKITKRVVKN